VALDEGETGEDFGFEETMALRAVVPVVPLTRMNSGGNGGEYKPWPMPDDGEGDEVVPVPASDTTEPDPGPLPKPHPGPNPGPHPIGQSVKNWAGPFPVRRAILAAPLPEEEPAEKVDEESEQYDPEGVGHTGTFALAAIQRQTGAPSKNKMAHRTAQRIQNTFTAAGWDVAIWYGEYTEEFWVMDHEGLHGFKDVTSMYRGMGWQTL